MLKHFFPTRKKENMKNRNGKFQEEKKRRHIVYSLKCMHLTQEETNDLCQVNACEHQKETLPYNYYTFGTQTIKTRLPFRIPNVFQQKNKTSIYIS